MLPVLIIQCAQSGLLYINGAFCGELTTPQMFPLRPDGRVYVEFRPLAGPAFPLAVALDVAGGQLQPTLPKSAYAVQWPDALIELELRPMLLPRAPSARTVLGTLQVGNAQLTHQRSGEDEFLCFNDLPLLDMPSGMRGLRAQNLPGSTLILGAHDGGECAWLLTGSDNALTLADQVHAQQITLEADGTLRALKSNRDVVGHAQMVTYRPGNLRLEVLHTQNMWASGTPNWPQTAQDTFIAYLQALRSGAQDEAAAYLTPAAQQALSAAPLPNFDAAVPLPRPLVAPPPDRPLAMGLLEKQTTNQARVRAVCARAISAQHAQGSFLLEQVSLLEEAPTVV